MKHSRQLGDELSGDLLVIALQVGEEGVDVWAVRPLAPVPAPELFDEVRHGLGLLLDALILRSQMGESLSLRRELKLDFLEKFGGACGAARGGGVTRLLVRRDSGLVGVGALRREGVGDYLMDVRRDCVVEWVRTVGAEEVDCGGQALTPLRESVKGVVVALRLKAFPEKNYSLGEIAESVCVFDSPRITKNVLGRGFDLIFEPKLFSKRVGVGFLMPVLEKVIYESISLCHPARDVEIPLLGGGSGGEGERDWKVVGGGSVARPLLPYFYLPSIIRDGAMW